MKAPLIAAVAALALLPAQAMAWGSMGHRMVGEAAARALPPVLECYLVAGDVDYFIKLRVKDIAAFNRLHSERLIALPGVRQVRTFFVLNEIKTDGLLPI